MAFDTYEESAGNGEPQLLFKFSFTNNVWYYTTGDRDYDYLSNKYAAIAISCGKIPSLTDTTKDTLDISLPRSNPVAQLFLAGPPTELISVTIWSNHLTDVTGTHVVIWKGHIASVDWQEEKAVISCETIFKALNRSGLGPRYSRQCITDVYSSQCKLIREQWFMSGIASSISGADIIIPEIIGQPDNWFAGGYLEFENLDNGNIEYRFIRSSVNTTGKITLNVFALNVKTNQTVKVYPGCDHQLSTCDSKFGNALNYRGQPYIPTKNPFGGSPLY